MKFGKNQLLAAPVAALLGLVCAGAAQADSYTFMTTTDGTPYMMETSPVVIERSVVTSPSTFFDATPTVITHPVTIEPTVIDSRPLVIKERRDRGLLHLGLPLVDFSLF
jgi:hypothetical protein